MNDYYNKKNPNTLSQPNKNLDAVLAGIKLNTNKVSDVMLNKLNQLGRKLDAVLNGKLDAVLDGIN